MGFWGWSIILLGAVVAGVCCLFYQLLVQNGRLLLRMEALERRLRQQGILPDEKEPDLTGLPIGTLLNDFALPALGGGTMTLSQWRGRRVLLVFVNPGCNFCRQLLEELAAFHRADPPSDPVVLFITTGDAEENRRWFEQYHLSFPVLLQEEWEVASFYKVHGTPVGYWVDVTGVTASEALVGVELLLAALRGTESAAAAPAGQVEQVKTARRGFSRSTAESRLVRDGLKAGTRAPEFTLPRLDGTDVSLRDYRGQRLLLVFSDPECTPCIELAPKLEQIHRRGDIQVLMISRRDRRANEEKAAQYGLTFPIVLQRHWEISRAYGMFATPIGYLIDAEGTIVSDVAVGTQTILSLASRPEVFTERIAALEFGGTN